MNFDKTVKEMIEIQNTLDMYIKRNDKIMEQKKKLLKKLFKLQKKYEKEKDSITKIFIEFEIQSTKDMLDLVEFILNDNDTIKEQSNNGVA